MEKVKTVTGKVIEKRYVKLKTLGSGAFATCFVAENVDTKKQYAAKVISKDNRNRIKVFLF